LENKGGVMTTIELKKKLIKQINNIEDELLLQEVSRLIDTGEDESDIYYFTEEESRAIEEAREQYAKGEFLSNEEANKEVDEWLGK
jgi:predicted transcriptional regulator